MNTAPLLYFPTTVMIVDDNKSFLENLSLKLSNTFSKILYQNPTDALLDLKNRKYLAHEAQHFVKYIDNPNHDNDQSAAFLDHSKVYNMMYNVDRFSEVTTVLIDYSMPQMTGLEFCEAIADLPLKKIMVTAEAGHNLAVKAFNEGIIDAFILKDISTIFNELTPTISKMQHKYFSTFSNNFFVSNKNEHLKNANFQTAFAEFLRKYNIVEYFCLDEKGSYVGLDLAGKPHWYIVKMDSDFSEALDIAQYNKSGDLIDKLKNRDHLLFLFSEVEKKLPVSAWDNYLFPVANQFSNNANVHYVANVSDQYFSLDKAAIKSYDNYLQSQIPITSLET